MSQDFDAKLRALHERFIENISKNTTVSDMEAEFAVFSLLSPDEKIKKVDSSLELLDIKEEQLREKLKKASSQDEVHEINNYLKDVTNKRELFQQKLELLKNLNADTSKKEKLKRQLTQLEIKRCKNMLDRKDCRKLEAKIAHKKEIFKKFPVK